MTPGTTRQQIAMRGARGFTLIEVIVSMSVLAIALVGIAQMQVVATTSNASGRELNKAAQIATMIGQAVQSWDYADPRLATNQSFVGSAVTPRVISDSTDTFSPSMGYALGNYSGATTTNVRSTNPSSLFPGADIDPKYRVYWWVGEEDNNGDGVPEAKVVSILVRWKHGNTWHNHNQVQARFNMGALKPS